MKWLSNFPSITLKFLRAANLPSKLMFGHGLATLKTIRGGLVILKGFLWVAKSYGLDEPPHPRTHRGATTSKVFLFIIIFNILFIY